MSLRNDDLESIKLSILGLIEQSTLFRRAISVALSPSFNIVSSCKNDYLL